MYKKMLVQNLTEKLYTGYSIFCLSKNQFSFCRLRGQVTGYKTALKFDVNFSDNEGQLEYFLTCALYTLILFIRTY